MIAGVLLVSVIYFVVGRAAAVRNTAQTAADAAALAAAHDARDQLRQGWLQVIRDPSQWGPFLNGVTYRDGPACQTAAEFAARNASTFSGDGCVPLSRGFRVTVQTKDAIGSSVVPGTETRRGTATATAVVEPRCVFDEPVPTAEPSPTASPPEEDPDPEPDTGPIEGLLCGGEPWPIDPENPVLPDADDLFHVRLTGDDE